MTLTRSLPLLCLLAMTLTAVSCSDGLSEATPTKQQVSKPSWTWIAGNDVTNQRGIYGTKGESSTSNTPGAREDAVSWIDSKDNLWLYGGIGYAGGGSNFTTLGDLWVWNGTNWIWKSGSNLEDPSAVYGIKGTPDNNNTPGAREDAISWVDSNDVLWLFGGLTPPDAANNYFRLNDLWSWDGENWTWVSGANTVDQFGIYGNKGEAASTNIPGARDDSVSWIDSNDNLWLFGGGIPVLENPDLVDDLNDLWMWDGENWTWVSGSDTVNSAGVYGTKGSADVNNMPSAREDAISWVDSKDNLWLFGGLGYDSNGAYLRLNDLWRWDGSNWTWISGSESGGQIGVYGEKGVAAEGNRPGSRTDSIAWVDSEDSLWLFGGWGYDSVGTSYKELNDLWRWDGTHWTWISGSDTAQQWGTYGSKGVTSINNIPGARLDSIAWVDSNDNLWLFGGEGYDRGTDISSLNDLWQYKRFELVIP